MLEGCKFCYTADLCLGCQEGYDLVVDHCKPCGVIFEGCKYCSSYSCIVCEEEYGLVVDHCKPCGVIF